jgi:hypothetical protein
MRCERGGVGWAGGKGRHGGSMRTMCGGGGGLRVATVEKGDVMVARKAHLPVCPVEGVIGGPVLARRMPWCYAMQAMQAI